MTRFNFTVVDDQGLEDLVKLTKRTTKAEVVRDALAVYQLLARRIAKGEHLFLGTSKEQVSELSITSLEAARLP